MKTLIASALIALSTATAVPVFANAASENVKMETDTRFWVVSGNNGKIDVNVVKSEIKDLSIELLDGTGHILASSNVAKDSTATRTRFDLTALPDGEYKVILTDGKNKQVKTIELNTSTSAVVRTVSVG